MNILVAIDDSKFSEAAASAVVGQAKPNDKGVRLLQLLEPFPVAVAEKMGSKDSCKDSSIRVKADRLSRNMTAYWQVLNSLQWTSWRA